MTLTAWSPLRFGSGAPAFPLGVWLKSHRQKGLLAPSALRRYFKKFSGSARLTRRALQHPAAVKYYFPVVQPT